MKPRNAKKITRRNLTEIEKRIIEYNRERKMEMLKEALRIVKENE
jgi:flagellar motor switch protein FliM